MSVPSVLSDEDHRAFASYLPLTVVVVSH
jgi:hypothetical protein